MSASSPSVDSGQRLQAGANHILFDPDLLAQPQPKHFDPEFWSGQVVGTAEGRQTAYFLEVDEQNWVLRHFWRGGLPGKLLRDQYLFTGVERSRPFREWRLLAQARAEGVQVPRPVAVRINLCGAIYTGDILIERIVDAQSLADMLAFEAMSPMAWRSLAMTIARCHQAGYWHADLNARNLLHREGRWWLIDFDRARKRKPGTWGFENIRRLKRSLDKLRMKGELRYRQADWNDFVEAWHVGLVGQ